MILLNLNMWKDLNESARFDKSHSLLQYTCIILTLVISVSGLIFSLVPYAIAQNSNPTISPPDSRPQGLTYGQWAAKWWQWAYSIPRDQSPLYDQTGERCGIKQTGPVWFLAGTFGGSAVRQCTIPAGISLFFPILNTECSIAGGDGKTEQDLRKCAKTQIDRATNLELSIDGVRLQDLQKYRAQSQLYTISLPANNIMGVAATTSPSIAEGYWIFLNPLSPGKHEIRFGSAAGEVTITSNMNFVTSTTYHITVK
jgi:hypothetical protein